MAASVLQVHDRLVIRTPTRTVRYDLSRGPVLHIRLWGLLRGVARAVPRALLRTSVTRRRGWDGRDHGGALRRSRDRDCSGWRRALRRRRRPEPARHSFGLETRTTLKDEGLTFLLDSQPPDPAGPGLDLSRGPRRPDRPRVRMPAGRSSSPRSISTIVITGRAATTPSHGTYFPNRSSAPQSVTCSRSATPPGSACRSPRKESAPRSTSGASRSRLRPARARRRRVAGVRARGLGPLVARYRRPLYTVIPFAQWMAAHTPTH